MMTYPNFGSSLLLYQGQFQFILKFPKDLKNNNHYNALITRFCFHMRNKKASLTGYDLIEVTKYPAECMGSQISFDRTDGWLCQYPGCVIMLDKC